MFVIVQWAEDLNKSITETDPVLDDIMEKEKLRQRKSIVLIASEVSSNYVAYCCLPSFLLC